MLDTFALLGSKVLVWLMCWLPEPISLWIARVLIAVLRIMMRRIDAVGMRNLELVFPEKSITERKAILSASYEVLARNLATFARIPRLTPERVRTFCKFASTKELLDRTRAAHPGVGVLLPTAHFGPFEQLVQIGALVDRPVAILARGFGLPKLDAWWFERRATFGNEVFFRKGATRQILQRLQAGQDVTMLCDQNVKANHATFVDFFGIPAATVKTVGLAALRTGAPVVFLSSIEQPDGSVEVHSEALPHPSSFPGEPEEQVRAFCREMNRALEDLIRKQPDHWFWIHRRFKTRPPGEPELVYQGI